jgi:hypothetical protein
MARRKPKAQIKASERFGIPLREFLATTDDLAFISRQIAPELEVLDMQPLWRTSLQKAYRDKTKGEYDEALRFFEALEAQLSQTPWTLGEQLREEARLAAGPDGLASWSDLIEEYQLGDEVEGTVASVDSSGILVELQKGFYAHVEPSEVPRRRQGEIREYAAGDEVKARVIAIDTERERLGLTLRKAGRRRPSPDLSEVSPLAGMSPFEVLEVIEEMMGARDIPRAAKSALVLRSFVVTLESAFEILLANVAGGLLQLHPGAIGVERMRSREFSLQDLLSYDTLGDAKDDLISRQVDSLLNQGVEDWAKWFDDRIKIQMSDLAIDWGEVKEVIYRRHAIVHSGGRASRQYLALVQPTQQVPLGTDLVVDRAYFDNAVDALTAVGLHLGALAWAKLDPEDIEEIVGLVHKLQYSWMLSGRWSAVKKSCQVARDQLAGSATDALVWQMNEWLADKYISGRPPDIARAFDSSTLEIQYRAVHAAIVKDEEAALEVAREWIRQDPGGADSLKQWPVFAELREVPAFDELWDTGKGDRRPRASASKIAGSAPATKKSSGRA